MAGLRIGHITLVHRRRVSRGILPMATRFGARIGFDLLVERWVLLSFLNMTCQKHIRRTSALKQRSSPHRQRDPRAMIALTKDLALPIQNNQVLPLCLFTYQIERLYCSLINNNTPRTAVENNSHNPRAVIRSIMQPGVGVYTFLDFRRIHPTCLRVAQIASCMLPYLLELDRCDSA